jgi:hypothetical protein
METREFVIRVGEDGIKCGIVDTKDENTKFIYHKSQNDWLEHIHAYADKVTTLPVFIHGLWGEKTKIYNRMVKRVSRDILPDYPLVLHLVWEGRTTYSSNHSLIDEVYSPKVAKLMIMVDKILNRPHMNILAHSLGCRMATEVFKSVMKGRSESQKYSFIFAAGDLAQANLDQFISEFCKPKDSFQLLYNPKDLTLKLANLRKKYPRIGLYGSSKHHSILTQHLIPKQKDEEIFISSLFGHRYFYTSRKIRRMIRDLMEENGHLRKDNS